MLALADLKDLKHAEIKAHIADAYDLDHRELDALIKLEILIAYESVGNYGCDSASWFLVKDKNTGVLYENHASHCSCYGFEGQWEPEETTIDYLMSENFHISTGGYDEDSEGNMKAIKQFIAELAK